MRGRKGEERPPSYTASHGVRSKERYTEIEKERSPEAKDRWNNLSQEKLSRNKPS